MAEQSPIRVEVISAETAIVSLYGEHDLESQARVAAALMAAGSARTVAVDLSRCTFADSSIITVVLRAARAADERGGVLVLVVPPAARSIRRTLEITGVTAILLMHSSLTDALAGCSRPAELRRAA